MHPGNTETDGHAIAQKPRGYGVKSPYRRVFHPLGNPKTRKTNTMRILMDKPANGRLQWL